MERALREQRGELQRRWQAGVADRRPPEGVRPDVRSSWERSARSVHWDVRAAPVPEGDAVPRTWERSRFGRACRVILDDLRDLAEGNDMVAAVADDSVTIAWMAEGRTMTGRAERVHFTEGGSWAEAHVGTNALSLARDTERPATVFSAEHYAPMVHDWVCYSAPVLDPTTGRPAGVIDLSGGWQRAHRSMLTTVGALARCVEYELAGIDGAGAPPARTTALSITALGRPGLRVGDVEVRATRRQLELLTVLALHPEGLRLGELTALVYGDQPVSASTVKAELSHLRHLLGGGAIASRPYRLVGPLEADFLRLRAALGAGDLTEAIALYRGPLLPDSESPELSMWRHHLDVALREAVLAAARADLLFELGTRFGEDLELHEATLASLDRGDPRRSEVAGRLAAALQA